MTTNIESASGQGDGGSNRIEQLSDAAQLIQDFTYDLAMHLDPITTTELMLTSRRLERLAERLAKDPGVVAALEQAEKLKSAPEE